MMHETGRNIYERNSGAARSVSVLLMRLMLMVQTTRCQKAPRSVSWRLALDRTRVNHVSVSSRGTLKSSNVSQCGILLFSRSAMPLICFEAQSVYTAICCMLQL